MSSILGGEKEVKTILKISLFIWLLTQPLFWVFVLVTLSVGFLKVILSD